MKVEVQNKKGLTTTLSIVVEKKDIQIQLDKRLNELQSEVSLKGFRPGKVPSSVIKSQFGKAIYGEVIDKILSETSKKALDQIKIKTAGQPKIDLKTFGEGKDLNYILEVNALPEIKLKPFSNFSAQTYSVKTDVKLIDEKIEEIAKQHKSFVDKKNEEKSILGDQVTFDYSASVDGKKFEGSEGKGVQLELGKDLFLSGFDKQLVGVKKNDTKTIQATLPANHPKKELANKKTLFECKILNVKKSEKVKIDDNFAVKLGAKNLSDLRSLVEKQISSQYKQALDSITKKEILDQVEKQHEIEVPKNLVDQEVHALTHQLKKEDIEKHKETNTKIAKSRIKLGLILNEYGESNNLKVSDEEVRQEIQKQIKSMPGQEKMVLDYYQKNPNASQGLKGGLYEEKILDLFKSKIKISSKTLTISEAEKIISEFNNTSKNSKNKKYLDSQKENKEKKEKKPNKISLKKDGKTKKVSKK